MESGDGVQVWIRPLFVRSSALIDYAVFCYADRDLDIDLVADPSDGYPEEAPLERVRCRPVKMADFEEHSGHPHFQGPIVAEAETILGRDRLDRLRQMYVVEARLPDPEDLSYLQTTWAMVRQIVRAGACLVREEGTRLFGPQEIMARDPRREFSLASEMMIIEESTPRAAQTYVTNTRGMHKFARPDLLCVHDGSEEQRQFSLAALSAVCSAMARGAVFEGGPVELHDGRSVFLRPYEPGINGPREDPLFGRGLIVQLKDSAHGARA